MATTTVIRRVNHFGGGSCPAGKAARPPYTMESNRIRGGTPHYGVWSIGRAQIDAEIRRGNQNAAAESVLLMVFSLHAHPKD
jgi:hypothetical protein